MPVRWRGWLRRQEALADTMASFFEEERYQHARALEGLAEAEHGETIDDAAARHQLLQQPENTGVHLIRLPKLLTARP